MRQILITITLITLFATTPSIAQESTNHFPDTTVLICRAENHPAHLNASPTISKLYKKLGYKVKFIDLPNKRSVFSVKTGQCHAEVGRIQLLESDPDLVLSTEPVHFIQARAYAMGKKPKIKSWEDFKSAKIGAIRGELYAEKHLQGKNVFFSNGYRKLFSLLSINKVEYVVGLDDAVSQVGLKKGMVKGEHLLFKAPLFHVLNKKHKTLLPEIDAALREIKGQ